MRLVSIKLLGGSEVSIVTDDINDETEIGVWYHLTLARDHSSDGSWYVNGKDDTGNFKSGTNDMSYSYLGDVNTNSAYSFNGQIDELRISTDMKSSAWIETSYNSMNDPSSFMKCAKPVSKVGITNTEECKECEKSDSGICDFLFRVWDYYFKKAGYCWEMASYFADMERDGLFYMYICLMYLYGQAFGIAILIMERLECENFP